MVKTAGIPILTLEEWQELDQEKKRRILLALWGFTITDHSTKGDPWFALAFTGERFEGFAFEDDFYTSEEACWENAPCPITNRHSLIELMRWANEIAGFDLYVGYFSEATDTQPQGHFCDYRNWHEDKADPGYTQMCVAGCPTPDEAICAAFYLCATEYIVAHRATEGGLPQ